MNYHEFQASSAVLTFNSAVSYVKGGKGGRPVDISTD